MALDITPAKIKDVIQFTTKETLDIGGPSESAFDKTYEDNFTFGTGAGALNRFYWVQNASLADTATDTIDVFAPGNDRFGNAISNITKVKLLIVVNNNTVDGDDLVLGGNATEPWLEPFDGNDHKAVVKAGGRLIMVAPKANGIPVSNDATSGHNFDISADSDGGNALSYTFLLGAVDAT